MEFSDIKKQLIYLIKDLHSNTVFDKDSPLKDSDLYWADIYLEIFGLAEVGIGFKNLRGTK